MPQNITLMQLQFLNKRLSQFVDLHFSPAEQRELFMTIELERIKLEQSLTEEKSTSKTDIDETQVLLASDLQQNASLMEQIRLISDQLDLAPFDHSLWEERSALWKKKGDQTAMLSDLLRARKYSRNPRDDSP